LDDPASDVALPPAQRGSGWTGVLQELATALHALVVAVAKPDAPSVAYAC